jgi:PTH1 family peptidyl-tRNA hydrolase
MYLIVGLGNPGREYADTRHNVGFMVIDRLCIRLDARLTRYQFKSLTGEATYEGQKLLLVKPRTYMNLSGQAVSSLVRFYKLPLERLLVIHDDLDLPPGSLRLRPGGGSAGQKGVQSIIDQLCSSQFPRLRIGIGRPPGQQDAASYVLQPFQRDEWPLVSEALLRAVEVVLSFVTEGLDKTMTRFNARLVNPATGQE